MPDATIDLLNNSNLSPSPDPNSDATTQMLDQQNLQPSPMSTTPRPGAIKSILTSFATNLAMNLGDYFVQRGGGQNPHFAQNFEQNRLAEANQQSENDYRQGQTRIAQQNANTNEAYKNLAGEQYALVDTPPELAAKFPGLPAQMRRSDIAGMSKAAEVGQNKIDVATLNQGPQVAIPEGMKDTVKQFGIDPSKPISVKALNQVLGASGKNERIVDIGAKRYKFNIATGEKEELGAAPGLVAGVARAGAFARAKAAYTPVEFQDPDTGEVRTGSALEALQTGQPTVTKPNGGTIQTRNAVMNDIEASLKQLKDKTAVLDGGNRGKIAAVLADPNNTATKFLQSELADSLSQDEQDYVIQNLNAREQIYGLRKALTGASGGSEGQAAQMLRTIPGAQTPNSKFANQQIDTSLGVLGRLRTGIQKLPKGNQQKAAPSGEKKRVKFGDL